VEFELEFLKAGRVIGDFRLNPVFTRLEGHGERKPESITLELDADLPCEEPGVFSAAA
jgi:hypothetical protein